MRAVCAGEHRAASDGAIGPAGTRHARPSARVDCVLLLLLWFASVAAPGSELAGAHSICSLVQLPSEAGSALIFVESTYLRHARAACARAARGGTGVRGTWQFCVWYCSERRGGRGEGGSFERGMAFCA